MKRRRKEPEPPQYPGLSEGEAEFNRWMEQVDLEALDLERLARQAADAAAAEVSIQASGARARPAAEPRRNPPPELPPNG